MSGNSVCSVLFLCQRKFIYIWNVGRWTSLEKFREDLLNCLKYYQNQCKTFWLWQKYSLERNDLNSVEERRRRVPGLRWNCPVLCAFRSSVSIIIVNQFWPMSNLSGIESAKCRSEFHKLPVAFLHSAYRLDGSYEVRYNFTWPVRHPHIQLWSPHLTLSAVQPHLL